MTDLSSPAALAQDPLLLLIAGGWTALLLLHAALAKLADRPLLHQHLAAYRVPESLQPLLLWALPITEAIAAIGLVTPWRSWAALLAAALLLAYGAAMAWHLAHGRVLDCGCGGAPLPLSGWLVGRNAVLAALALLAALPALPRPLDLADWAVVAAAMLLGTLLMAAFGQVLRQALPRLGITGAALPVNPALAGVAVAAAPRPALAGHDHGHGQGHGHVHGHPHDHIHDHDGHGPGHAHHPTSPDSPPTGRRAA